MNEHNDDELQMRLVRNLYVRNKLSWGDLLLMEELKIIKKDYLSTPRRMPQVEQLLKEMEDDSLHPLVRGEIEVILGLLTTDHSTHSQFKPPF